MKNHQTRSWRNTRWQWLMPVFLSVWSTQAQPLITDVVETNGDNEPTDTITAKWTGITFNRTVANEPNGGAVGTPFTVPAFGEEVPAFVDRNHQWTAATPTLPLPKYLLGGEYIMSGNDNRDNFGYQLDITISDKAFVYMLVDDRLGDTSNANPPNHPDWALDRNGDGLPDMAWIVEDGWEPVRTGQNRHGNPAWPDHIGMDEGADGAGPGQGVNQWASIYMKVFPAGTFSIYAADNNGQNMYGAVLVPYPKKPIVTASRGDLLGFTFTILDGSQTQVKADTISATLNGTSVPVQSSKNGDVTTVTFTASPQLASESVNTAVLTFSDTGTPATEISETLNFTVDYYATLTSAMAVPVGDVDLTSPGFRVRIAQAKDNVSWPGFDLPNSIRRAEDQLAGRLIDPVTSSPLVNTGVAGPHTLSIINLNQEMNDGGNFTEAGNFTSASTPAFMDEPIPGIGAVDPDTFAPNRDNIAAEITAYLDLPVGLHRFGVNSDDGFLVTASKNPHDATGTLLGFFNGGRGSADSLFYVDVKDSGLYPVRLVWFEGGGGANVEFFAMAGTDKILINSDQPNAIKAYSKASSSATVPPNVSVAPVPRQTGVPGSAQIQATLTDANTQVDSGTVKLNLDGTEVAAQVTKNGGVTTVTYTPTQYLAPGPHSATLAFTAGTAQSYSWTFEVADWTAYPVVAAAYKVPSGSVNLANEGFLADVYQIPVARTGFPNANDVGAAERQIARGYIDPATGQPYENLAMPGSEPDGRHVVSIINWDQLAPANAGGFNSNNGFTDQEIPGVGAYDANYIAAEMISYVELQKGIYRWGVNCDDGFKLTVASDPRSQFPTLLGLRSPGGGSTDVLFNFVVEEDGIYPMRLLWWEGTGGANVEFFVENLATGARALLNDRTRYFAPKAYRTYTGPARPYAKSVFPAPGATGVFADAPIDVVIANAGEGEITLTVNGNDVTPQITTTGTDTRVIYQPDALLPSGSVNTATITFAGMTNTWSFTVAPYITIPVDQRLPLDAFETGAIGMLAKVVQAKNFTAAGTALTLDNSTARAEAQLAGTLIDPDTQQPYVNEATPGNQPDGRHLVSTYVNWNQDAPISAGNFVDPIYPDDPIPGVPGSGFHTDNIAAEVISWLELPQGLVKMGVNSDDGFRVTLAKEASPAALELGVFEGGRGVADTLFSFAVPQAGLYPVRLIWYEGNGGAAIEFFTIDATGQKVLVNDRTKPTAVKSWYAVEAVAPAPVIGEPLLSGGNITINWSNGGTLYSAPAPTGPWTSTADNDGSFTEPATGTKFYRVQR